MVKGVIHFHSNYSYDGCDSIDDIVAFLKKCGCSFLFLTEHDDDFDQEKMERFVQHCERVSSSDFLVVPGIEFRCKNKVHILGLGIKNFIKVNDPVEAAIKIKESGGKAVIAHPMGYLKKIGEELIRSVDAIEVWNGAKDGKIAPDYTILKQYEKWKVANPNLSPLCGADHHSIRGYFPIETILKTRSINYPGIWTGLSKPLAAEGRYFLFKVDDICPFKWFSLKSLRYVRRAWHFLDGYLNSETRKHSL